MTSQTSRSAAALDLHHVLRGTSPPSIMETFVPPTDYRYPYLG